MSLKELRTQKSRIRKQKKTLNVSLKSEFKPEELCVRSYHRH